jgi:hypothetical protein
MADDLRRASWIARERGSATRSEAEAGLASAGILLTPAMELGSNEAVKTAVAAGLGFGLLSRLDVAAELAAGRLIERTPEGWDSRRLFCVCYRRDRRLTRAEIAFLRFINCDPEDPSAPGDRADPEKAGQVGMVSWESSLGRFATATPGLRGPQTMLHSQGDVP